MTRARLGATRPVAVVLDPQPPDIWDYGLERELLGAAHVDLDAAAIGGTSSLGHADVVLVHEQMLDAAAIAQAPRCVGIVTYSVGTNQVDLDAAARAGIAVRNSPTWCTDEVSDHALALTLALFRRLDLLAAGVRDGDWDPFHYVGRLRRLRGSCLGIIGAGRIGRQVARKARAFGFRTVAHDPYLDRFPEPDLELVALDRLLADCDVVVLCAPLTPETERLIDARALGLMSPDAILVNVSRGRLVDEDALALALRTGVIGGAGLDVRASEPPDQPDPLAGAPNLILTPHVAGVSMGSFEDLHREAAITALALLREAGRLAGPAR